MPTPAQIAAALQGVHDHVTLVNVLLRDTLLWPIDGKVEKIDDIAYQWSNDDFRAQNLEDVKSKLKGPAWQIQPFHQGQPWGIFLLEFADEKVYRTVLRQVLRGLVPNRRRDPSLPNWPCANLLFICTTAAYDQFTFAHFRGD